MIYEFTISYSDGHKSFPIATSSDEFRDQLSYCQTGKRDGWIKEWTYKVIEKTW